jgi:hypothetical protein
MSCEVVRFEDGGVKLMRFSCDTDGCDALEESPKIKEQGGLTQMGWIALGGRHYCPQHRGRGQWQK